jgi:hypothetical protein
MLSPNGTTPKVDQATRTEASGDFPQLRGNEGRALQRRWYATSICIMDYPNYSLLNGLDRSAKAEMPFN